MKVLTVLLAILATASPAVAIVGNAPNADPVIARHVVLIVGSRGNACTGVVIARDVILTVAHCVPPGSDYKWISFDRSGQTILNDVATVTRHPQFDVNAFNNHRATADIAVMKLPLPLPANYAPVSMTPLRGAVAVGQRLLIAGYGLAMPGDGRSGGKARQAMLTVTGQPGTLQIRLVDPSTNNAASGLGGCTGDSGAGVFDMSSALPNLIGLVSWTTAARNDAGCGGLTGVTPLSRYRGWILEAKDR